MVRKPARNSSIHKPQRHRTPDPLAKLRTDFDRLVERMQTPAHNAGIDALFAASGPELGAVAVAHARKGAPLQAETKQKIITKKRIIDRMVKSTARASVAIDDAVAYVERSNRRIADLETKKRASKGKNEKSLHILFVCSLCRLRSPTAEQVFATRAGWKVMAAGINAGADNPVTTESVEWADTIFVMEETHRRRLTTMFSAYVRDKRIFCLNIPDKYDFMDPRLVRLLKHKVPKLLHTVLTAKRIGIAKGLFEVPESIDAHNEEVTRLSAEDSDRVTAFPDQSPAPTALLRLSAARLAGRGKDKNGRLFSKLAVAISKAQAELRQQYREALERVAEVDPELEARLVQVLGTKDNAAKWFFTGHMLMNGRSPLELVASRTRDVVLNVLGRIEYGGFV